MIHQLIRFMDSEIELDEEIKKLHGVAATPELFPVFVELNTIPSLIGLLAHENVDILLFLFFFFFCFRRTFL